jgi:hypothetical protein
MLPHNKLPMPTSSGMNVNLLSVMFLQSVIIVAVIAAAVLV